MPRSSRSRCGASFPIHAVSERYLVRDARSGDQQSYRHPRGGTASSSAPSTAGRSSSSRSSTAAVPGQRARRRAPREVAIFAARAHVLDGRLAPHERVVLMVAPGVNCAGNWWKRWSGVASSLLWGAIGVGRAAAAGEERAELGRVRPRCSRGSCCSISSASSRSPRCSRASCSSSCGTIAITCRARASRRARSRSSARWSSRRSLIVYLFSLEFLNRGIDSWFRVEVKQGLNDALVLSRAALDVRMREYSQRTERLARVLAETPPEDLARRVDEERRSERRARSRACSASTSASSPRASTIRWNRCPRVRRRISCGR